MPSHKLKLYPEKNLAQQLAAIPSGTLSIRLVFDYLPSAEYLQEVISGLPKTEHLNLSLLRLSGLYYGNDGHDFISLFHAIALHEPRTLNLSGNALFFLEKFGFVRMFNTFPLSLEELNLSGNQLYKLPPEHLAEAFALLSTFIQVINLSGNFKYPINGRQLCAVLDSLHADIRSLDLSNNAFFNKEEQLLHIMGSLKQKENLKHLNLSRNFNGYFHSKMIVAAFHYLPQKLTSLNMSNSSILYMRKNDLIDAFSTFPTTLYKLDISGHKVNSGTTTSHQQLEKLIAALKRTNVCIINLGDGESWKAHPNLLMELVSVLAENYLRNLSGSAVLKLRSLLELMTEPFSSIITLFGNDQSTTDDLRRDYLQLFKTMLGFNLAITPEFIELIYKQYASQLSIARYTLFSSKREERGVSSLKQALSSKAKRKPQNASANTLHTVEHLERHMRDIDQLSAPISRTRRATIA